MYKHIINFGSSHHEFILPREWLNIEYLSPRPDVLSSPETKTLTLLPGTDLEKLPHFFTIILPEHKRIHISPASKKFFEWKVDLV